MSRRRRRSIGDTFGALVIIVALVWAFAPGVGWDLLGLRSRLGWPPVHSGQALSALPDSEAARQLRELTVRSADDASAVPEYDRAAFGQRWADIDHNGCDTRNDILASRAPHSSLEPTIAWCFLARSLSLTRALRSSSRGVTRPRPWFRSITSSLSPTRGAREHGSGMPNVGRSSPTIRRTFWRSTGRRTKTSRHPLPTSGYRPTSTSAATMLSGRSPLKTRTDSASPRLSRTQWRPSWQPAQVTNSPKLSASWKHQHAWHYLP